MAQPKYGSITIVDLNDKGQLSVFPTSNMPLSVIYDAKQNTYTPDWGVNNLILTPIIYYGNRQITATTSGVTVTWKRREGSGNVTDLTTGETVSNGVLTVSVNKFTPLSSMISYIVHVDYLDAEAQTTLIAEGQITINLNKNGESGDNARLFELYTIGGNVFTTRDSQNITIYGRLMDGSEDVTITASNWIWSKWEDGAYVPIIGETDSYLVVNNSTVDGFGAYRATCQYDDATFTGYYSLIDRLDPLQATAICSLGEQIVNGQGVGVFYVLITDTGTGTELDPLKSNKFLTSAPENPVTGDYYYHLNTTNKDVVLKKYDGEKWVNAESSELPIGDYTWSFRDKNGSPTTLNKQSQIKGKVIYVDGTLINDKKIIADVKAEVAKTVTYASTTLTSYNSIINTEVYYYKSSSATELIDGEWSTEQPEWEENKYIWQKIRTLYEDGTTTEGEAANISGQHGQSGTPAISYKLNATQNIITKLSTGEYSINSITFNSTYKQGENDIYDYLGRFVIQYLSNNSEWVIDYTSIINESTIVYNVPPNVSAVRCSLYKADSTDILLDLLTIPVVKEGSDGKDAIGLISSLPIYLTSNKDSEIKITDIGWTRYKPELTNDKRYLWSYQVLRYANGDSNPELIKLQGDTIDFEYHGETSPLEEVIVDINFVQQGSGDPSPDNIRPITGWSAININPSDMSLQAYEDDKYQLMMSSAYGTIEENVLEINNDDIIIEDNIMTIKNTALSYNITFPASIGTVYKGYLNVTTGILTVTYGYIDSYAGETIDGIWISDRDIYVEGTAPTIGAQVIYELSTPLTYKITPQEILALSGTNKIWADTGDISISYYDNQKITAPIIDQSLTSVIEMTQDVASKVMATYGISSSLTNKAIKNVDCENFELYEGTRIQILFENSNTVLNELFLNVNNTGSKAIYVQNELVSDTNQLIWSEGALMEFVYNNNGWHLQNAPFTLFGSSNTIPNQTNKIVDCIHCVICKGTSLSVNMTNTNTAANATLNVGATLPIDIYANGAKLTTNSRFNWRANTVQKLVFDGQVWRMDDDSVKALATAYITEINNDGIMVHPEDDSTSGWAISDAIQLFKNGISYIKLWIEDTVAKIRIGKENQGHIILDNDSIDINNGDTNLASFGEQTRIGAENSDKMIMSPAEMVGYMSNNQLLYRFYHYNNGSSVAHEITEDNGLIYTQTVPTSKHLEFYYTPKFSPEDNTTVSFTAIIYDAAFKEIYSVADSETYIYEEPEEGIIIDPAWTEQFVPSSGTRPQEDTIIDQNSVGTLIDGYGGCKLGVRFNILQYNYDRISVKFIVTYTTTGMREYRYYTFGDRIDEINAGDMSFIVGNNINASGENSIGLGKDIKSLGAYSYAQGLSTQATADYSYAEGCSAKAQGIGSHAEGISVQANKYASHAEGYHTITNGDYSHAQNYYTTASSHSQTAIGKYNKIDSSNKYALIIGNGNASEKSNALALTWDGNVELFLDVNAASSTTDGQLYAAIHALGWDSDVLTD